MSKDKNIQSISPEEAAARLMVEPQDIIKWIEERKLIATKDESGKYRIEIRDFQKFARPMPNELREKMGERLFSRLNIGLPDVRRDVNKRFRRSTNLVLDRAELAIQLLERLHKKYENKIDVFNDRNGIAASFIVFARVISLLHSLVKLLRSGIPAESSILFRPLWEAILLAEYFMISETNKENNGVIRRWFEKNESPKASVVRNYIANKLNKPVADLRKLYTAFSKPLHHSYDAIMQSYKAFEITGFLGTHTKRLGFDYHESSIMRDVVTLVFPFEALLHSSLNCFYLCFSMTLKIDKDDLNAVNEELTFYKMNSEKRLDVIFENARTRPPKKIGLFRFIMLSAFGWLLKLLKRGPISPR